MQGWDHKLPLTLALQATALTDVALNMDLLLLFIIFIYVHMYVCLYANTLTS